MVAGTKGYERYVSHFIESSRTLAFNEVCKDFIAFLPDKQSFILDVGSGAGQNAAALADRDFNVVAVEPMHEFYAAAQTAYKGTSVKWLHGSLPNLECLKTFPSFFDFALITGVWHHLDFDEREVAAARLSELIKPQGRCALTLRNGPPGIGTRVYPTDSNFTISQFSSYGFQCVYHGQNQPSTLPNKTDVKWSRIVMEKN